MNIISYYSSSFFCRPVGPFVCVCVCFSLTHLLSELNSDDQVFYYTAMQTFHQIIRLFYIFLLSSPKWTLWQTRDIVGHIQPNQCISMYFNTVSILLTRQINRPYSLFFFWLCQRGECDAIDFESFSFESRARFVFFLSLFFLFS